MIPASGAGGPGFKSRLSPHSFQFCENISPGSGHGPVSECFNLFVYLTYSRWNVIIMVWCAPADCLGQVYASHY